MDHQITILTLTSPAPTGTTSNADRNTPFSNAGATKPLNLDGAQVETLEVSDNDTTLDGLYPSYGGPDADQVLSRAITLDYNGKAATLLAGQKIGFDFSGRMFWKEGADIKAVYEIAFLRIPNGTSLGAIVAEKYVVMVIPISYTLNGKVIEPQPFNLLHTHYYGGNVSYISSDRSIEYYDVDCFASGTLIDTPDGPRPVETLRAGDLVVTRDDGARPLVWAGRCHVGPARLDLQPNLRPIRITAGALAPGCPSRDLTLSPQHRVLVRSPIALRLFGSVEILVAVKHLVGLPGIEVLAPADGVGYHHLLFADHQVVSSEGAWTESLFLGPQAMQALDPAARREVMALFPELAETNSTPAPARRLLTGREGRKLAERHGRNGKPLMQEADARMRARPILLPA